MKTLYDAGFYREHGASSARSAAVVVPFVVELLAPRRVADVGCGAGEWLAAFSGAGAGVDEVVGFEGPWIDGAPLAVDRERIRVVDLERSDLGEALGRGYDLAVCLEVAEHLAPDRAEPLVDALAAMAPAVLFSAAIPDQGGTGHRHERWQSYWAALFAARGYRPVDAIRSRVWDDPAVAWWYAQNTILYVEASILGSSPALRRLAEAGLPLDVVHPRAFAYQATLARALDPRHASLKAALRRLPRIAFEALRRALGRSRG